MECRDRIGTKWISNIDKGYRSASFRLTSSRPVHVRVHNSARTKGDQASDRDTRADRRTPLVRALALHGVSEPLVRKPLGLNPSRSVACIRRRRLT